MEELKRFEVGECYYTRDICDHDCIYAYQVTNRTAKTVILQDKFGKIIGQRRISIYEGKEIISPEGSYSMSPMIDAGDILPGEGTLRERVDAIQRKDRVTDEAEQRRLMIRQRMKTMFEAAVTRGGNEDV